MLNEKQIAILKDAQLKAIEDKSLTKEQLALIYVNNWFNIWVPRSLSGEEYSLIEGLSLIEELAYWDAGFSWTVTLCAGANMFAGFIEPSTAKALFADSKICFGGSGAISGTAKRDGDSYVINGLWKYATGSPHLTHFTLNAEVIDDHEEVISENNKRIVLSFLVPRDQVLVHFDWDSFGLECTASHSFSLNNVRVPADFGFSLENNTIDSPLYSIPFLPFAELTLLMNYIGMYRRFLDLLEKYFFQKSKDPNIKVNALQANFKMIDQARLVLTERMSFFMRISENIWNNCVKGEHDNNNVLFNQVTLDSKLFVAEIREQITKMFPLGGINASQKNNELNIIFRNFFTATQHRLLNIIG